MGKLNRINLEPLIAEYNIENFVETGTGEGVSLSYALLQRKLKYFWSIEIDKELYRSPKVVDAIARLTSKDQQVTLIHEESVKGLRKIIPLLSPNPTLFWLDAHFPGYGYQGKSVEASIHGDKSALPVVAELCEIAFHRKDQRDVIIIDDLILFEPCADKLDGRDDSATLDSLNRAGMYIGSDLTPIINTIFGRKLRFYRLYKDTGYLLVLTQ
jgi:hypothetical protein